MSIGTSAIGVTAIGTLPFVQVQSTGTLVEDTAGVVVDFSTNATISFVGQADMSAGAVVAFATDAEIVVGGSAATVVLPTHWTADESVTGVWTPDNPIKGT